MTRKENLIALRDAVVGGNRSLISVAHWSKQTMMDALRASNGNMNAALSFVAEVLPDACISVRKSGKYGHATVDVDGEEYEANNHSSPARALLIAALNALIEETEE